MTTYTDPFGGSTIQVADVAYRPVALSASIVTVWPPFATTGNEVARIMDVTPSAGSLTVTLPDATLVSPGQDVLFTNRGAQTYTILDAAGGVVATVAAGVVKYLFLSDNSTAAGTWSVTVFGVGSSNLDAASLAGLGLKAITTTLNAASTTTLISADHTVVTADRALTYVWTGGTGTFTLPLVSVATGDFFFEVRNQGTGTLTIAGSGGELIDASASIALQLNESCFVHAGPAAWYTVGRGRNTQFNFTQLVKAVTGGTNTLTLTEAANVVQTYTGILASAETVVLPGVVQVYYIRNQTTGAFNFRVQSPTPGSVVDLPSGQNSILFCDGVNVYNATTYVTTVTSFPALTVTSRSSNTILVGADRGVMFQFSGTYTQTFTAAATLASGWYIDCQNVGTGIITLDASGAETFNTASGARATICMYPGEGFRIVCNGVSFDLVGRSNVVQLGAATSAVAATTVDLENGYSDNEFAKIEAVFSDVVVSSVQLAARFKKTGSYITGATYSYAISYANGAAAANNTGQTSALVTGSNVAADYSSGILTIVRPTAASGRQMIMSDAATPQDTVPKNNRALIGISETTSSPVQGVRFIDVGGGTITGTFSAIGYRG